MTHIYESLGLNELNVSIKWVVPFYEQWDQLSLPSQGRRMGEYANIDGFSAKL